MRAVDAGILAAAVNRFAPEHPRASRVLDALANGDQPWAIPWPAAHEFLQVVSHPHLVVRPLAASDALGFLELLLASPQVRALGPGPRHAAVLREILEMQPEGGSPPPGLATAAVLREHGVRELLSADRGMRAFSFLTIRDPLRGSEWTADEKPERRYRRLPRTLR
jgi:toxin-antitoxin system PIN domain toxin